MFNWERTTKIKVIVGTAGIFLVVFLLNFLVNTVNFNTTKIIPIADATINEEIRASLEQNEVDVYFDVASDENKSNIEKVEEIASLVDAENVEKNTSKIDDSKIVDKNEESASLSTEKKSDSIDSSKSSLTNIIESSDDEKIINDDKVSSNMTSSSKDNIEETVTSAKTEIYKDLSVKKDEIDFTVLGEIMMGGKVTANLNYEYVRAFRDITKYTRDADFTYGTLPTNITSLEKFQNLNNKYLVTKDIKNAFVSLGIDALSIATPHIADYDKTFFGTTIDNLKLSKIYMAGINNSTLFVDVAGKKLAIISALSSYTGNKITYNEFGVNLYSEENMKRDIAEAKDKADFVIVDVSWGREDKFGTTATMTDIAYKAIDAGANLVMGTNALGIYPMYEYKGVPIIYSTGRLITDSDYTLAERSYIWKFTINKENKVSKIDMIPILTFNNTETKEFMSIDPEMTEAYNELINKWNNENGLNSRINSDATITVLF